MGGMAGFNVLHPFAWFASGGDPAGDVAHNHAANTPDGNFFNDLSQPGGAAHVAGAAAIPPSATGARYPVGAYAGYANASLQAPGVQAPLAGGPVLMKGAQQGPWAQSDYAAALPSQYTSAAPPWKNGPMQAAAMHLPIAAQAAVHATGTSPPVSMADQTPPSHHTVPAGAAWGLNQYSGGGGGGGGSSAGGCGCGCNGGAKKGSSMCRGKNQQAVGLDSTNDFPPLYSSYHATPNQAVNTHLYQTTSTHMPSWTTAQGTPGDLEQPLQGQ